MSPVKSEDEFPPVGSTRVAVVDEVPDLLGTPSMTPATSFMPATSSQKMPEEGRLSQSPGPTIKENRSDIAERRWEFPDGTSLTLRDVQREVGDCGNVLSFKRSLIQFLLKKPSEGDMRREITKLQDLLVTETVRLVASKFDDVLTARDRAEKMVKEVRSRIRALETDYLRQVTTLKDKIRKNHIDFEDWYPSINPVDNQDREVQDLVNIGVEAKVKDLLYSAVRGEASLECKAALQRILVERRDSLALRNDVLQKEHDKLKEEMTTVRKECSSTEKEMDSLRRDHKILQTRLEQAQYETTKLQTKLRQQGVSAREAAERPMDGLRSSQNTTLRSSQNGPTSDIRSSQHRPMDDIRSSQNLRASQNKDLRTSQNNKITVIEGLDNEEYLDAIIDECERSRSTSPSTSPRGSDKPMCALRSGTIHVSEFVESSSDSDSEASVKEKEPKSKFRPVAVDGAVDDNEKKAGGEDVEESDKMSLTSFDSAKSDPAAGDEDPVTPSSAKKGARKKTTKTNGSSNQSSYASQRSKTLTTPGKAPANNRLSREKKDVSSPTARAGLARSNSPMQDSSSLRSSNSFGPKNSNKFSNAKSGDSNKFAPSKSSDNLTASKSGDNLGGAVTRQKSAKISKKA